jgi:hypothetical protein
MLLSDIRTECPPTSTEDGPLGLVKEGATSMDNNQLFIDFDSVSVFGDRELDGDAMRRAEKH